MTGTVDWDQVEDRVMSQLLPFQRRTVDWAFHRLYGAEKSERTNRFLVADEVGLGKTLVAKAVIAKALRHLDTDARSTADRKDVIYICSNEEIAAQNLARLRMEGLPAASFKSQGRLTLLPLLRHGSGKTEALGQGGVNFLSLTPTTSLNPSNDTGMALERALICQMVQAGGFHQMSATTLRNLFANRALADSFESTLGDINDKYAIDADLQSRFLNRLSSNVDLQQRLCQVATKFYRKAALGSRDTQTQHEANQVIGALRAELAEVCLEALEPDLVVLDEFQRFPQLMDSTDEHSRLAQQLFTHDNVRLLMLSATPYRLWADEAQDPSGTGHYKEFISTISFLQLEDREKKARLEADLRSFNLLVRQVVQGDKEAPQRLRVCRRSIEAQLSLVMSRTDRVSATADRDAMVRTCQASVMPSAADFIAYAGMRCVATELEQPDMIEYWRSAPYPLSFLSAYKVRETLSEALKAPSEPLRHVLDTPGLFMPSTGIDVAAIPNARTRNMAKELIAAGMHRLAWIPPSLPYYLLGGGFEDLDDAAKTKRLIFSSWKMVPRALSTVLDGAFGAALLAEGVAPAAKRHSVENFDFPVGYPCGVFASDFAPAALSLQLEALGITPTAASVRARAEELLAPMLDHLMQRYGDESLAPSSDWYWLAPLLLDLERLATTEVNVQEHADTLLDFERFRGRLKSAGMTTWTADALDLARRRALVIQVFLGGGPLGRMPEDLLQVASALAIAGPATCALRSFADAAEFLHPAVRAASSALAYSLMGYLGNEQMIGLLTLQYPDASSFWRRVLELCSDGCWSAVHDEYVAVLSQDRPASNDSDDPVATWLAMPARISKVLSLNPSVLRPETVELDGEELTLKTGSVTLRHARPLLERESSEVKREGASSLTELRNAFNSPFMPFVLSSTSVGQEGLDFHWYCHAIVHWNVPHTPVDFEQRDGRIHRFRNHAVRRNIAQDWAGVAMRDPALPAAQQWRTMFDAATNQAVVSGNHMEGLRPSWIYSRGDGVAPVPAPSWVSHQLDGSAEIERHVPTMPYSRDVERYEQMTRAVGCYRLVFAQPRQEDLLSHLMHLKGDAAALEADMSIDLKPPSRDRWGDTDLSRRQG